MKSLAKNIGEFEIGCKLFDKDYNKIREVSDKTTNSIQVAFKRDSKKGIDCKNWFDMFRFNIRFRKATEKEIKEAEQKTKKTNGDGFNKVLVEKTKKITDDIFIPKVMNFTTAENFART